MIEPPRIALMKRGRVDAPAEVVRARILDFLAADPEPELADIRIVRSPADLDAKVREHVRVYLEHVWR